MTFRKTVEAATVSTSDRAKVAGEMLDRTFGDQGRPFIGELIPRVLCDLMHLADLYQLDGWKMAAEAAELYEEETETHGPASPSWGERDHAFESDRYSGWDRIHDDNKAEGRPIGNQWSSRGVDYSTGQKVHRTNRRAK